LSGDGEDADATNTFRSAGHLPHNFALALGPKKGVPHLLSIASITPRREQQDTHSVRDHCGQSRVDEKTITNGEGAVAPPRELHITSQNDGGKVKEWSL
jgi:hypothetical protein